MFVNANGHMLHNNLEERRHIYTVAEVLNLDKLDLCIVSNDSFMCCSK